MSIKTRIVLVALVTLALSGVAWAETFGLEMLDLQPAGTGQFQASVPRHGVVLVKLTPAK